VTEESYSRKGGGYCRKCEQRLDMRKLDKKDSTELHDAFLQILWDRPYDTMEGEIHRFQRQLKDMHYTCVVDGLNVSLMRRPGPGISAQRTQSSQVLLATLKRLNAQGLKPLTIHRPYITSYPDYKEIRQLSEIITFDKLSEDDPYFMLAALAPDDDFSTNRNKADHQNHKLFVSNDILNDHYHRLPTAKLKRTMTWWQTYHQIKPNAIFNDYSTLNVFLLFPQNEDITATRLPHAWHLPLDYNENKVEFLKMRIPENYLCISPTDVKERTDQDNKNRFPGLIDEK